MIVTVVVDWLEQPELLVPSFTVNVYVLVPVVGSAVAVADEPPVRIDEPVHA